MPFFKDLSLTQISCKNQIKYSLSEKTKTITNFFSPDEEAVIPNKKGILSHLKKASLTVEAAIVIPLFFTVIICMASVMGIYTKTFEQMSELRESAEQIASAGISGEELWIDLTESVDFSPLFIPEGINMFNVWCGGSVRSWTGRTEENNSNLLWTNTQYVYVTENGTVYHTSSSCTQIDLSIRQTGLDNIENLRNENGGKYHACEKCSGDLPENGTVFITSYGNRYHCSSSCSSLKRTVKMVEISKAKGLGKCERCASVT